MPGQKRFSQAATGAINYLEVENVQELMEGTAAIMSVKAPLILYAVCKKMYCNGILTPFQHFNLAYQFTRDIFMIGM
jgi:hypothetical protein